LVGPAISGGRFDEVSLTLITDLPAATPLLDRLLQQIETRSAVVGVVGLGYVGLPMAIAAAGAGFRAIGFDVDPIKVQRLSDGVSYIDAVPSDTLEGHVASGHFRASASPFDLSRCDIVVICVPTPLTRHREPDLQYIVATGETLLSQLGGGQLVVLESTSFPGTTEEVLKPVLERGGLRSGRDFFLAFSPEREDPGNRAFKTTAIPKIVAGDGHEALKLAESFYGAIVDRVVSVSSVKVAEATKITENVFRAVNIALVNELKVVLPNLEIPRIWADDPLHRARWRDQREHAGLRPSQARGRLGPAPPHLLGSSSHPRRWACLQEKCQRHPGKPGAHHNRVFGPARIKSRLL
jgi:hypothetical protein